MFPDPSLLLARLPHSINTEVISPSLPLLASRFHCFTRTVKSESVNFTT